MIDCNVVACMVCLYSVCWTSGVGGKNPAFTKAVLSFVEGGDSRLEDFVNVRVLNGEDEEFWLD